MYTCKQLSEEGEAFKVIDEPQKNTEAISSHCRLIINIYCSQILWSQVLCISELKLYLQDLCFTHYIIFV